MSPNQVIFILTNYLDNYTIILEITCLYYSVIFLFNSLTHISPFRKQIGNGLWPTTWNNLLIALVVVSCIMYIDHPKLNVLNAYMWKFGEYMYLDDSYPYYVRLFVTAAIISVIYFIILLYTRQYILRILLSWTGWLCKYIELNCLF